MYRWMCVSVCNIHGACLRARETEGKGSERYNERGRENDGNVRKER
jgi:hypothetical protein